MPAGAPDPAKLDAEAVYAEFLRRVSSGDPQDLSDLCNQHPQLAGHLLDLHDRCETIGVPDQAPTAANGATTAAPGRPLQPATQRYGILERLAHGGMGIIYRAWDGTLRRELAMKLIRDKKHRESHEPATSVSPETLARFVREAEVTARLDHPGVVPIHDMGTDDLGRAFFTMRLVQGQRLDIVFELARLNVKRWSQTRVLDVIVKICETVAFAHSRGVIHRDLKPMNIMVGRFGETYVMDWGLAKILRDHRGKVDPVENADAETVIYEEGGSSSRIGTSDLMPMSDSDLETKAGAVLGTAAYMPPEQAAGQISQLDERSDIYSVGAILYELLAGRRPYAVPGKPIARTREVVSAVIAGPPSRITSVNPRVPAELVSICEKAMERRKEDRYQNMTEMAEDLRAYLENRVVRAHQTGAIAELRKWVSRNRWTAISSATGLAIALALLATVVGVQSAANKELSEKNQEITNANKQIIEETTLKEQALTLETQARQRADRELARAEGLILARASADVVGTNPGQALLVALESARKQPSDAANTALLAALASHHETATFRGHQAPIRTAIISQDGSRAATASIDRTVIIWDLVSRQPITWLIGHSEIVNSVQFSPDAKRIATGSYDSTARIWDANSGQLLAVMKGHQKLVWRVAFNPAGDRLATASFDGTVRLWDATTGNPLLTVRGHGAEVLAVEFSADGRRLLTGSADRTARLWDAASGTELAQMPGHDGGVGSAQYSPDGSQVLTIAPLPASDLAAGKEFSIPSIERAARVWSAETGQ
ncbi:MAG: serine/threonine protein kinase, partial [Planctomycetia bacterium]|nr:serine/threonine protein kinase [Planctomycetia bacterium]